METRQFLAGMRPDELARLRYLVEEFSTADLEILFESLENLRVLKRFGQIGLYIAGAVVAIAGAVAALKAFLPTQGR